MTNSSAFKTKLVMTTALAASLLGGYGRRAYAACAVTISPSYSCSGYNAATQTITVDNATVSTVAGFDVVTAAGNAITITGDGALSFTDAKASTIHGYSTGLEMIATGNAAGPYVPGSITIDVDSIITGDNSFGIYTQNNGAGATSITADGAITGSTHGIFARNGGTSITITTGSTVTGTNTYGIYARNFGSAAVTITANGDVTGRSGIYAGNAGGTNITVTTEGAVRGTSTTGIYARNTGSGTTTITANDDVTGYTHGIFVNDAAGDLTITTGAGRAVRGTTAQGIRATNDGSGALAITANGDITGYTHGIEARNTGGASDLTITTAADTVVTGRTRSGIFARNDGSGSLSIDVEGDVTGHIYGILVHNSGGSIVNSGNIKGLAGPAIALRDMAAPIEITLDGGRVIGDVEDANYASGFSTVEVIDDFTTEGDFLVSDLTVGSGKVFTISAGNEITLDTMSKSGGASNAVFNIGATDDATFGKLVVTGADVDLTDVDITVKVTPGASFSEGAAMLVMDGTAPITGGPGGVLTAVGDDSPFWDFSIVDGTFGGLAGDNSELYLIAGAALSDEILGTLLPDSDISVQALTMDLTSQGYDIIEGQISALRDGEEMSGMSAGVSANGASMWLQTFGQTAEQDQRGGVAGYDANTLGIMVGADSTSLIKDGVLGVSFNYGKIHADSQNANTTDTEVDSYGFILYGSRKLGHETFLDAQLGYAWNMINSERHDVGGPGVTAKADYGSAQHSAKLVLGRDHLVESLSRAVLTPTVSAAYTHLRTEGYTETGPGGLTVDRQTFNVLKLGIGANAAWKLQNMDGSLLKPMIRAGYAYNAINDEVETTASFADDPSGTTFNASGPAPSRNTFNAGVGLTYTTAANFDLSANYDYSFKSDYRSHAGVLRATGYF